MPCSSQSILNCIFYDEIIIARQTNLDLRAEKEKEMFFSPKIKTKGGWEEFWYEIFSSKAFKL